MVMTLSQLESNVVDTDQMDDHHSDSSESLPKSPGAVPVTFFPSLNDTRRAWILHNLRRERVTSVLDVGCGEGTLLGCLCNPPAFFDMQNNKQDEEDINEHVSANCDTLLDLHISRLAGLDISAHSLEKCINTTGPLVDFDYHYTPRWEPLEVNIWHGSLDVYNPEFVNTECIVASEVIEHLLPPVLSAFASTLLGSYRPHLLLITTPNYSFNARFSAPGTVDHAGFPDPTGRTTRVFRHHDHKFEWTPSEFKTWCTEAASTWGYFVEVDAVGLSIEVDPWGREEELGRASQVALFRRIDDWPSQHPISPSHDQEHAHKLLKTHVHLPHPRAGLPEPSETIINLVSKCMESYYFDDGYSIWDLWVDSRISIACGGRLDALFRAIEGSHTLSLTRKERMSIREWNVRFTGEKHREEVERTKDTQFWERQSPKSNQSYRIDEHAETQKTTNWPDVSWEWYELGKERSELTWASIDA